MKSYWINRYGEALNWQHPIQSAPVLRHKFTAKSFQTSFLKIAAPGYCVIYLNGKRVSNNVLSPVVTQFDAHIGFVLHEISTLLRKGENTIAILLGNGWYNCATPETWHFDKASWRNIPRLWIEVYADETIIAVSDDTWKCHDSALVFNALRNGETFDARLQEKPWYAADLDDSQWNYAQIVMPPPGTLIKEELEQCVIQERIEPTAQTRLSATETIFDFGKNLTGFCEIQLHGNRGAEIKIEYSELLKRSGDIDPSNISCYVIDKQGFQTDRYILSGKPQEFWHAEFAYHGFRYVKVTIIDDVTLEKITACYVYNNFPRSGHITTSNETVNQLIHCTENSFKGNFTGIPTDCPHREKNGWTGDAWLACETGLWTYDATKAYSHFIQMLCDCQRPSGQLPGIAPSAGWGYNWGSGPAWDIALFEIPYRIWQFTKETKAIELAFNTMQKYLSFCKSMAKNNILYFGLGDWCHPDNSKITSVALTSTAFYYHAVNRIAFFTRLLGMGDDDQYQTLADTIKRDFIVQFRNPDGTYGKDEPTANAVAIYFGLDNSLKLAKHLNAQMANNNFKVIFGILGAKMIPRVLAGHGYHDSAFQILTQPEFPGWGYWIRKNATSLWENWDGGGSQMHIMFGDINAWFYEYLGGIKIVEPGFEKIKISPYFAPELTLFDCKYITDKGEITVKWESCNGEIELQTKIPTGIVAELTLPGQKIKILKTDQLHTCRISR